MNKKVLSLVLAAGIFGGAAGYLSVPVHVDKYIDGSSSALQWQLNSGEVMALQYQAYNTAERELEDMVKKYRGHQPVAVVLDLDETVINNYGNTIADYVSKEGYAKERFTQWALQEEATIIPGADSFLHKAEAMGVEIFYVTNRYPEDLQATINNLQKLGLPSADEAHVLIKTDSSNKTERVEKISETHDILMFVGDNLGDFPSDFYKKLNSERQGLVNENEDLFGSKYIILPNASYGDWDSATFGYDYKKSDAEKIADRDNAIESYNK